MLSQTAEHPAAKPARPATPRTGAPVRGPALAATARIDPGASSWTTTGRALDERSFRRGGEDLAATAGRSSAPTEAEPDTVAVAVETRMARGFRLHAIDPTRLDRVSPAAAKDDRPTARPDPRRCNAHDRRPSTPSRSPSLKGGASHSLCGRAARRRRSAPRRPLGSVLRRRRGIVACRRSAAGPISAGSGSTRAALTWHRERTGSAPAAQACPPTAAAALRTSVVAPAGVGRHDASTSSCSSSHGSRSSGAIAGDM